MQHRILYILLLLISYQATSQKIVEKIIDAATIETIIIDGNDIYSITILVSNTNTIRVKAFMEGEYAESVVLKVKEDPNTVLIGKGFLPYFQKDNDKLAAHKVLSIALEIEIPKDLFVSVSSDIAMLEASGSFDFLYVSLENGNCTISEFIGDADIQTSDGDITVIASRKDVSGKVFSKYGVVKNKLVKGNRFTVEAYSIRGNITLLQTD